MGFSRQEYWSGWPFPSPGALPDPGMEPVSLPAPAVAGGFLITAPPGKPSSSSPRANCATLGGWWDLPEMETLRRKTETVMTLSGHSEH